MNLFLDQIEQQTIKMIEKWIFQFKILSPNSKDTDKQTVSKRKKKTESSPCVSNKHTLSSKTDTAMVLKMQKVFQVELGNEKMSLC